MWQTQLHQKEKVNKKLFLILCMGVGYLSDPPQAGVTSSCELSDEVLGNELKSLEAAEQ